MSPADQGRYCLQYMSTYKCQSEKSVVEMSRANKPTPRISVSFLNVIIEHDKRPVKFRPFPLPIALGEDKKLQARENSCNIVQL